MFFLKKILHSMPLATFQSLNSVVLDCLLFTAASCSYLGCLLCQYCEWRECDTRDLEVKSTTEQGLRLEKLINTTKEVYLV